MKLPQNTIEKEEALIVEEFSLFDDWMDKYAYIIELGEQLPCIEEAQRQEQFLVPGCQSKLWLVPQIEEGRFYFSADADAIIVKGLAFLIWRVLNGRTLEEVKTVSLGFIETIGLKKHLSVSRSNGLNSMIQAIKSFAEAAA